MIELISVQELCDRTGLTPAKIRRYHDQFSRVQEDPFPAFLYEYKTTVIADKGATVDWLERIHASMVERDEKALEEANDFIDQLGGPDRAHVSPRLGFGKERQRSLKRLREARETASKAPGRLEKNRGVLAALREMYGEMAE
ncbi:hypothetical protein [Streptomyces sp. RTd22]|uniref:hypothetical protein n=1 Tax=Streptomyces sp. RTd22 TaxID=1841249 RepID=UPI00131E43BE|nr:hypothetical protein [Streptomyces sp. RTd22]